MRRIMLIGPSNCGKTTLLQALNKLSILYKKTQAVEIVQNIIDTPGEYLERRSLYRALAVTAADADVILLMQEWKNTRIFPPGFASMFGQKPIYGIVCKVDTAKTEQDLEEAMDELLQAGATEIIFASSINGQGIETIKRMVNFEKGKI